MVQISAVVTKIYLKIHGPSKYCHQLQHSPIVDLTRRFRSQQLGQHMYDEDQ